MEFSNPLGIEYRVVGDMEHLGQPARSVRGSRTFQTDSDDLWDALTNAERLPRWFLPISGELKMGGRYQLDGNAGGKITRCDPPVALEVTWEYGGNVSWVILRLEPDGDGTRLTLEHIMGQDETSEDHWKKYGPGATGVGWDLGFLGLGMHLATGETIEQKELYAWMATDPGKEFVRHCARAWGDAHVASGEPAENALSIAATTAAFYTGEGQ